MIYKSYLIEQNINLLDKKIFLFYGENLGLKNEFKQKIKVKSKETEIINFSQEEIVKNENIFFNEILNISLFTKEKIYFIDQANDKILDLIQSVESKLETQKIFIFSETLDKRSKLRNYFEKSKTSGVVACYPDNEIGLKKIILNRLRGFENLSLQNIDIIIEKSNLDRSKLNNEIDKIISYFSNKKLDNEKLELLLDISQNENFDTLRDEAFNGHKIKTNQLLSDTVIITEKNILYLNIINQRLNKLAQVLEISKNTDLDNAINMIKPPIFWKDKPHFIKQIKKWNLNKIKNILKKTYNLEIEIKSNASINKNVLLKKLIIDICMLANA
jgi:DNA polymerase-3 subunit delta